MGEELFTGVPHQEGAKGGGDRAEQADAKGGVAQQHGAGADPVGDHGRVVEITRLQMLRPEEVVGFVRCQGHAGRDREPQQSERGQRQNREAHG